MPITPEKLGKIKLYNKKNRKIIYPAQLNKINIKNNRGKIILALDKKNNRKLILKVLKNRKSREKFIAIIKLISAKPGRQ